MVEINRPMPPESFGKLVDTLGSPSAIRVGYLARDYGPLQSNLHRIFGQEAYIHTAGSYPVTVVLKGNDGAWLNPETLKGIYAQTIAMEVGGSSPIILTSKNRIVSSMKYGDKKSHNGAFKAAIMLEGVQWRYNSEEGGMIVLLTPHEVAVRYHNRSNPRLRKLEKVLDSAGLEHVIATYKPERDFNEFVSSWS